MTRRCLVTGGAGFIGSHLVEQLLDRGDEVVVLDDFSTGRHINLEPFEGRFELIEDTVTDPAVCRRAMAGVSVVFHQAALGSVPRSVADPGRTHHVNATGTLNLLVAAHEAGIERFIYASSSSAYGDAGELPKEETMIPRPKSPYAVAKLTGENYCRAFAATYGLATTALRYFNVFGPRQDPDSQYAAVIPLFVTAALEGAQPTVFGDGEQSRDFTFVDNVVQANLLAAEAKDTGDEFVFNVGAGARTSVNELWRLIAETVGTEVVPSHGAARPGDVRHSLASLDRIRHTLGYEPAIDVGEGVRRTVAWYSAQHAPHSDGTGSAR